MFVRGRLFGATLALCWIGFGSFANGQGVETWEFDTRSCEQVMGSSPWAGAVVSLFDESSRTLVRDDPNALLARMAGRPVVILTHGNAYDDTESILEALFVRDQLQAAGGLPEGSLFLIYDWPSERTLRSLVRDLNEKARRARVAAYHLSRLLELAPTGSTICLMGQSDGARISLTTLHLLSGSELRPFLREPGAQLASSRLDLRLRCVALEAAVGHHWLDPEQRLEGTLPACEALLNLRNRGDYALSVYIYGSFTGPKRPLGLVGLTPRDRRRLGPLADRVEDIDHHSLSGRSHTLFPRVLNDPDIARRIAAYTSWSDVSDGLGKPSKTR